MKAGEITPQDYQLTYTVDPKRTFVIQPKEGEINYDLAKKNPLKFYDKVMNADVVEHKVVAKTRQAVVERQDGQMATIKRKTGGFETTSRLTKRAVARILLAVEEKLLRMISEATEGEYNATDLREALAHPQTKGVVQKHILAENIRLQNPLGGRPVYAAQMSLIGEKGDSAANMSPNNKNFQNEDIDPEEALLVSNNLYS